MFCSWSTSQESTRYAGTHQPVNIMICMEKRIQMKIFMKWDQIILSSLVMDEHATSRKRHQRLLF